MSKRLTKVLSLVLTLVMFLSVSTPAFAIGGGDMGRGFGRDIGENEIRDFEPAGEIAEEEELDYFQTTVEANGSQVTVEAPMGALPTLAELRAEPVETEDVRAAVESVLEGEANILLAMDISFWLNGIEIEPEEPVRVKISAPELEGKSNLTLVHIPDAAEPETVDLIDEENLSFALGTNEIAFEADSFSTYVVTWDGEKSATIHWGYMNEDTFVEFDDVASLDSNAGSMSLDVIFDGYMYSSAVYVKDGVQYGLDSKILTKVTAEGVTSWTMQAYVPVGEGEETELQTVTIENGADIYVYYVEKAEGYTPPSPAPADVKGPITEKKVTPNGDGTYTIRLDITGQQDHTVNRIGANVIVVMDLTQSMSNTMSNGQTRMAAARTALQTLINTLNPGTGEDQNLINFTVVGFANRALYYDELAWTQNKTTMLNYATNVNYITTGQDGNGTPWQSGLYGGIVRANDATTNDDLKKNKTYVIFVTDGDPNGYYSNVNADGGPATNPNYHSPRTPDFRQAAYDAAIPNAVNLSTKVEHRFYGVYCGGANDSGKGHLQDLMSESNASGSVSGTFIDGTSADAINNAFKGIAQTIVKDLGASEVVVDDGVPALTNVSAAVSGSAGGFKYYITPKGGEETDWTDAPSAAYSSSNGVTWDLSKSGVLADGTVYSLEFTVWPSQAAYDLLANLSNGLPGWKLNELDDDTLEQLVVTVDNVNYEYESGETAGTGTWKVPGSTGDGISTAALLARIDAASVVDYNVLTNTHLTTTYKYGDSTFTDPPASGMNSGAMILDTSYFGVHKVWNNGMDLRTANALTKEVDEKRYIVDPDDNFILDDGGNRIEYNSSNPDSRTWFKIDLIITEDGEKYTEITLYDKAYNGNSAWSWNKMYIAPGVLTHDKNAASGELTILEAGRDYSVKEQPGESYYWNLSAEVYHPMVINGVAWVLQLVDKDDTSAPALEKNTFQGDYYNIEGEIFKKLGTADSALITAVNDRRSILYVTKEVEETDAPEGTLFTYEITLENENLHYFGQQGYNKDFDTFWFSVQTDPKNRNTILKEGFEVEDATPEVGDTGFYWFNNGETVTVKIQAGQYIVFSNMPIDTVYTVEELGGEKMPDGFVFVEAVPDAKENKVEGVTYNPTAGEVDEENEMKVVGTIDESNSDYSVTYTNSYLGYFYVYHSSDNTIERYPMAVNGVPYSAKKTFDITAKTKEGSLYGGYYQDYGQKGSFVIADIDSFPYLDKEGTPYEGKVGTWTLNQAYTDSGLTMIPVSNTVYYLKEVPETKYLQPYMHYTYKIGYGDIADGWLISDVDDLNYQETGFIITSENEAKVCQSLSVTNSKNGNTVKLTAKRVFTAEGFLTYLTVIKDYAPITDTGFAANCTVLEYWVTPDGLIVTGIMQRDFGAIHSYNTIASAAKDTQIPSTIAVFGDSEGGLPLDP